jgi:branched-subunit amino acid transport protein|tara:strand:+ start:269 stop:421 length:153 start_codon:yes stop_codon:yes gene_type:complete
MLSGLKFLQTPLWLEEYVKFALTAALSAIVAASLFVNENRKPFLGLVSKI